jgi:hypothetical protein
VIDWRARRPCRGVRRGLSVEPHSARLQGSGTYLLHPPLTPAPIPSAVDPLVGALPFHAVVRLDGPEGLGTPPPAWATVDLLTDALHAAAAHSYTSVSVPAAGDEPARTFRWGRQLDVRPVKAFGDGSDITDRAVASYVAKYATKAAENIRGHFSSKSRTYSTTLGALRQERADYRAAQEASVLGLDDREPDTVLVLADWQYAGHGHTPGEPALAATIARDLQTNRETARDALLSEGSTE